MQSTSFGTCSGGERTVGNIKCHLMQKSLSDMHTNTWIILCFNDFVFYVCTYIRFQNRRALSCGLYCHVVWKEPNVTKKHRAVSELHGVTTQKTVPSLVVYSLPWFSGPIFHVAALHLFVHSRTLQLFFCLHGSAATIGLELWYKHIFWSPLTPVTFLSMIILWSDS
jgi:hypothetical protein